ncbi:MAG: glycosyltransferase [Candidatus Omnitrophica bacterium]|nr:glycosyltransferase [Candidatus Omnitrophota bacterium]
MQSATLEKPEIDIASQSKKGKKDVIFVISGMADIDIAANQSMKNTLKYLSEFGYLIHVFAAFPKNYRILQDPASIFDSAVVYHRSPNFLTPLFDFAKFAKDLLGRLDRKDDQGQTLHPNQKVEYYDEYNFFGRMTFAVFLFLYVPIEIVRVLIYFVRFKPKLFYGINAQGSVVASLLGKMLKVPVIQRWHGASYTEEDISKMKKSFRHKLLLLDGGFAKMMPSDAVVVTNDGTRGDEIYPLLNVDPKKLYFWRNGLDTDDLKLPEHWNKEAFKKSLGLEGKKILMTASRLVLWKRVDRAIDCLHKVISRYGMEDIVLVIVGHGREEIRLKQMARDCGIEYAVKFVGAVPHTLIAQYYASADIFLSFYEISNLGNPLLEAMYFGLPIVSLWDAGTSQLLEAGQSAFLLYLESLEEESPQKVMALLSDASLRKRMGEKAREVFDQNILSWKDRIYKEHELIQKLIRWKNPFAAEEGNGFVSEIFEQVLPSVTLIVPCWNEERYLRKCLDSILDNDYPKDRIEILVIDGMSKDKSREMIKEYAEKFSQLRMIDNPKRNVCAGVNLGVQQAKGEILFKMDAHSLYPRDYIVRCVKALETTGADNVGGKFVIEPGADTPIAKAIALAMGHPFGIGRYYQWMHSLDKPMEVETVSFGCFRKNLLIEKELSFNEQLSRGGDSEFNMRLREKGGRIVLVPDIVLQYFARPNLNALWKHQFSCSYWVVYWTRFGCKLTLRSFLPMFFVLGLFGLFVMMTAFPRSAWAWIWVLGFVVYGVLNLYFSFELALKKNDFKMLFVMPVVFGTMHLARGLGSLCGAWRRLWSVVEVRK